MAQSDRCASSISSSSTPAEAIAPPPTRCGEVMEQQQRRCEIRMVNLQEFAGYARRLPQNHRPAPGRPLQYDAAQGWTLGSPQLTAVCMSSFRMFHSQQVRVLVDSGARAGPTWWSHWYPISIAPMCESLRTALPEVPSSPSSRYRRLSAAFLARSGSSSTSSAVPTRQSRRLTRWDSAFHGAPRLRNDPNPRFYELRRSRRGSQAGARGLGLDPERPVGLVLFAGPGLVSNAEYRRCAAGSPAHADLRP